jgi:hypothetical protein
MPKPETPSKGIFTKDQVERLVNHLWLSHPCRIALPESFTLEQRAIHQLKIEQWEKCITIISKLALGQKLDEIETTYEPPKKGK